MTISPLVKVTGIDLAKEVSKEVVELIKQDVRLQRNCLLSVFSLELDMDNMQFEH